MKIGIVCYPTYGGSGVVASELGKELAARGHDVHIITYDMPFRIVDSQPAVHYNQTTVPDYPLFKYPPYTLASACSIVEVAENYGLDIIHAHYAIPYSIAAHLAQEVSQQDFKIITTLHGTDITLVGSDPRFFKMTWFGIMKSDAVTAVSGYLRRKTYETFRIQRAIEVVHNFIDVDRFKPAESRIERRRYAQDNEKILIHMSNFRAIKNVPTVVRVFARVNRRTPSRLILIGDGPEMPRVKEAARREGVFDRIHFLGKRRDVETILPVGDLFLLPSSHESFGLAALEAMSCGVPVIATNVGGLNEVVETGQDGLLCDEHAVECMARFAFEIFADPDTHREYRRNARQKVLDRFTSARIVPHYERIYENALNGHSTRPAFPLKAPSLDGTPFVASSDTRCKADRMPDRIDELNKQTCACSIHHPDDRVDPDQTDGDAS